MVLYVFLLPTIGSCSCAPALLAIPASDSLNTYIFSLFFYYFRVAIMEILLNKVGYIHVGSILYIHTNICIRPCHYNVCFMEGRASVGKRGEFVFRIYFLFYFISRKTIALYMCILHR